jgi:hypothetical protein
MSEKKLKFWIISDDPNPEYINMYIERWRYDEKLVEHVKARMEWTIVGEHLVTCDKLTGSADIIIMDMSSLTLSNHMNTYGVLRRFLRRHSASVFHLVCYVASHAKQVFEELEVLFAEEDCIMSWGHNGDENIANYMCDKTEEYYPYEKI